MMVNKSCRALQSQYWISNLATSRAWFTSRNFPSDCRTLGRGSSTWKIASQVFFFCNPPPSSSPNTAKTLNPTPPPTWEFRDTKKHHKPKWIWELLWNKPNILTSITKLGHQNLEKRKHTRYKYLMISINWHKGKGNMAMRKAPLIEQEHIIAWPFEEKIVPCSELSPNLDHVILIYKLVLFWTILIHQLLFSMNL